MKMKKYVLNDVIKEQIAIGISVVAKCQPCFQHHLEEAKKLGVTDGEIEVIVHLAKQIQAVSEQKMYEFVTSIFSSGNDTQAAREEAQICCSSETNREKIGCR